MPKYLFFGGSFNPIHNGHLIMATAAAAEKIGADKIVLIPYKLGSDVSDIRTRLFLCNEAAKLVDNIIVSDIETRLSSPSYAFNTVMNLKNEYHLDSKPYWLIGGDTVKPQTVRSWLRSTSDKDCPLP